MSADPPSEQPASQADDISRCGYVALVGRPNVGKSTLLNFLLGQKLAITSRKPQTTRHVMLGIKTEGPVQAIYVDTPGMHATRGNALNRYMNRSAQSVVADVDVVVMVVDRDVWTDADEAVVARLQEARGAVLCAINKIDRLPAQERVLATIASLDARQCFEAIVPVSALRQKNLDALQKEIHARLPSAPHLFPDDQLTDRDERFLCAEIVREKVMRSVGAELPYQATVVVDDFRHDGEMVRIHASIVVEREGQKPIIIGRQGSRLKQIGTDARHDIEALLGRHVALNLWVKVRSGWSASAESLRRHGYE